MEGKNGKPPDFALLIGKRLDKKKGGEGDGVAPPGEPSSPDIGDEGEDAQHKMSAMSDFISAVHAKSPEMASSALEDFIHLCEGGGEPAEEGPPPEEAA